MSIKGGRTMKKFENPIKKKKYINATEETKVEDQVTNVEESEEKEEESEDMNKGKNWKKVLFIGSLVTIGVAAAGKKIYDKFVTGNDDDEEFDEEVNDEPETEDTEG